jgi:hypothetical protein
MNPFSKRINPSGNIDIVKKYIINKEINQFNLNLNLDLCNLIGKEILIYSSRSDISSITNPSSYNTPRLYDEFN